MIYRPVETRRLWDTWLFPWNNQFHLFFLETQDTNCDHIGRAVSDDLVHWKALPSIRTKGKPGQWNAWGTNTGTVVRHDGRFYLFFGSIPNEQQVDGVYISDDLEHWQPYPDNPVLKPAGPYYLTDRRQAPYWPVDWRDPDIVWREEDKHYHAVLCARLPKWGHEDTGAAVAHVRSMDLIHWEHLPPVATPGKHFFHTELPNIFPVNGRYYLVFNTVSLGGIRIDTPSREYANGSFYMVGDRYEGPYTLPEDSLLIGSGYGKRDACCARTIEYHGQRLLCYHIDAKRPTWGAPKIIRARDDGGLWLQYFPLLEKLETGVIYSSLNDIPTDGPPDRGVWKCNNGVLTGKAYVVGTAYQVAKDVSDLHFQFRISMSSSGGRAGVILRGVRTGRGAAIILDFTKQRLLICPATGETFEMKAYDLNFGWTTMTRDSTPCQLERGRSYHLRCFARDEHFEVYLDDRWIFTTVIADAPKRGTVEFCVERGEAEFTDLRLAEIESLA